MSKPLAPEITASLKRAAAVVGVEPQVLYNLLEQLEAPENAQLPEAAQQRLIALDRNDASLAPEAALPAPEPESPTEALAARPPLEKVARLSDVTGRQTAAQVQQLGGQAAAWLRGNPPGRPAAIEPRGCPTPGACSCVEPAPPAPEVEGVGELIRCLQIRAASLGAEGANLRQQGDAYYFDRAAALLQQLSAPAPAVVPVVYDAGDGIRIYRTSQAPEAWAVRRNTDCLALALDGTWSYEPMPSSRTEEWLARHRFASAEAAASAIDCPRPVRGIRERPHHLGRCCNANSLAHSRLPTYLENDSMNKPLSPAAQAVLTAQAKQRCLFEWSNVNDPPCHPSDPDWNGCVQCIQRLGVAATLRAASAHGECLTDPTDGKIAVVRVSDLEAWAAELESVP